jgi:hypothetical protein
MNFVLRRKGGRETELIVDDGIDQTVVYLCFSFNEKGSVTNSVVTDHISMELMAPPIPSISLAESFDRKSGGY